MKTKKLLGRLVSLVCITALFISCMSLGASAADLYYTHVGLGESQLFDSGDRGVLISDVGGTALSSTVHYSNMVKVSNTFCVANVKTGIGGKSDNDYSTYLEWNVPETQTERFQKGTFSPLKEVAISKDESGAYLDTQVSVQFNLYIEGDADSVWICDRIGGNSASPYHGDTIKFYKDGTVYVGSAPVQYYKNRWNTVGMEYTYTASTGQVVGRYFINGMYVNSRSVTANTSDAMLIKYVQIPTIFDAGGTTARNAITAMDDLYVYTGAYTGTALGNYDSETDSDGDSIHLADSMYKAVIPKNVTVEKLISQLPEESAADLSISVINVADNTVRANSEAVAYGDLLLLKRNDQKCFKYYEISDGILKKTDGATLFGVVNDKREGTYTAALAENIGGKNDGASTGVAITEVPAETTNGAYCSLPLQNFWNGYFTTKNGLYKNTFTLQCQFLYTGDVDKVTFLSRTYNSAGKPVSYVGNMVIIDTATGSATSFGSAVEGMSFEKDKWYTIAFTVNKYLSTVDIYINGNQIINDQFYSQSGSDYIGWFYGAPEMNKTGDGVRSGGLYFDDFKVYVGNYRPSDSADITAYNADGEYVYTDETNADTFKSGINSGVNARVYADSAYGTEAQAVAEGGIVVAEGADGEIMSYYTVAPASFKAGTPVATAADGKTSASVTAFNPPYEQAKPATIIIAYYDGTELSSVEYTTADVKGYTDISAVNTASPEGKTVKVFYVDSFSNLKPLCAEIPVQ